MPARVLAGFVIGRPIDRAALQKAKAQAAALDDDRRARRRAIRAGAGVRDAELIEPGDRRGDRGLAVIDVVGDADRLQCRPMSRPRRRLPGRRRSLHCRANARRAACTGSIRGCRRRDPPREIRRATSDERHQRIGDVHQIDVAGQDQFGRHLRPPLRLPRLICRR